MIHAPNTPSLIAQFERCGRRGLVQRAALARTALLVGLLVAAPYLAAGPTGAAGPAVEVAPSLSSPPAFAGGPSDPLSGEEIPGDYLRAQGFITAKEMASQGIRLPRLFKDMYFDADVSPDKGGFRYAFHDAAVPDLHAGDFLWHGSYDEGITVFRVTGMKLLTERLLHVETVALEPKDLLKSIRFDLQELWSREPLPAFEKMEYPDGRVEKWTSDQALLSVTHDRSLRSEFEKPLRRAEAGSAVPGAMASYGTSTALPLDLINLTNYTIFNGQDAANYGVDAYGTPVNLACASQLNIVAKELYLKYTPTLKFTFDTSSSVVLQKADVELDGTMDFKALVKATAGGSCNLLYRGKPWRYSRPFAVWIVPMVAYLEVYPVVEASAAAGGWVQAGVQRKLTHQFGYRFNQDAQGNYLADTGWQGYKCEAEPSPTPCNTAHPWQSGGWICCDTGFQLYNPADPSNYPTWSFDGQVLAELRLEPNAGVYVLGLFGPRLIPTPSLRFNARLTGSSPSSGSFDYGLYGCFNTKFEFTFKGTFDNCSNGNGVTEELYSGVELDASPGSLRSKIVVPVPSPGALTTGNYSLRWTGMIEPHNNETYTFYANTNDGVRLWIGDLKDEHALIDDWKAGVLRERTATFTAQAGQKYSIKMEYFAASGTTPSAQLSWSSPSLLKRLVPQGRLYPCSPYYSKTLFDNCEKLSFRKNNAEDTTLSRNNLDPTQNGGTVVVGTPKLIAPIAGAFTSTLRPTFTWAAASNADHYEIAIGNDDFTTTSTSFTPTQDLRPVGQIVWKVRGYRTADPKRSGMWSEERKVDIGITVAGCSGTFYNAIAVNDVTGPIYDPHAGFSRKFKFTDINISTNPYQVLLSYTTDAAMTSYSGSIVVQVQGASGPGIATTGSGTLGSDIGLFVYVPAIYGGNPGKFAYVMIGPYLLPQLAITAPTGGPMAGARVTVTAQYVGRDEPWCGTGAAPSQGRQLPLLYTDGIVSSGATDAEVFDWRPSGAAGERTLRVTLKDLFGNTITRSVTVTFDPTLPYYTYTGPYGEVYKGFSISASYVSSSRVYVDVGFWRSEAGEDRSYASERECWGNMRGKTEAVGFIAGCIASAVNGGFCCVPAGSVPVFIVDQNQYTNATLDLNPFGTARFKEIYDEAARQLGKDSYGLYRVWLGGMNPSNAIPCLAPDPMSSAPVVWSLSPYGALLVWTDVRDETGYQVERAPYAGGACGTFGVPFGGVLAANSTSFGDYSASPNRTYCWRVRAKAAGACADAVSPAVVQTTPSMDGIVNGGFDQTGGWSPTQNPCYSTASVGTYGQMKVGDCSPELGSIASLSQSVPVPGDAATLRYEWYMSRGTGSGTGGTFSVKIDGTTVASTGLASGLSIPWRADYVDVSGYRGRTVKMEFVLAKTGDGTSYSAGVDNVSIRNAAGSDPSLYGYWKLDEIAGMTTVADSSGNNRNASVVGGTLGVPGKVGTALSLNGSGAYALTPDLPGINSAEPLTVGLWLKANAAGVVVDELGGAASSPWHDSWIEVLSDGTVKVKVWGPASAATAGKVSFGTWNHVALVYASGGLQGYVNGIAGGSVTGTRSYPGGSGYGEVLAFGRADSTNLGSGAWLNGVVDDVRVYARALSALEMQEMAGAGNIASRSTPTASSTYPGFSVAAAVDGNPATEWASNAQLAGAWIKLTWASPQSVSRIVLRDRPNPTDLINGGTLSFSDGTSVSTGALPNDGSPKELSFAAKTICWVKFTVDSAGSCCNSGLSELEVYGSAAGGVCDDAAPTWPAGSAVTASSIGQTGLTLTWNAANDNVGVTGYRVYKGGILLTTLGNVLTTPVSGLTAGTSYTFKVEAGDAKSNWSTTGPQTSATTLSAPPACAGSPTPTDLATGVASTQNGTLSWGAVSGATSYDVYIGTSSNPPFGNTTSNTSILKAFAAGTTYYWMIVPKNATGSASGCPVWRFTTATPDTTPPTISMSTPTANQVFQTSSMTVSGSVSDNVGVSQVQVNINAGGWVAATGTTSWSYAATVPYGQWVTVEARALDAAGNIGNATAVSVIYTDTTQPSVSITSPLTGGTVSSVPFTAGGTVSDSGGSGLAKVEVSIDAGAWSLASVNVNAWSLSVSASRTGGMHTIEVRATDGAGNAKTVSTYFYY